MKRPDAIEAARKFGYQIVAGSPEQMTARLHAEIAGREGTGRARRHQAGKLTRARTRREAAETSAFFLRIRRTSAALIPRRLACGYACG